MATDDGLASATLAKAPTGIAGFDEITSGGLPRGRVSLVCGGPGAGKSLLALQFLVSGATELGEPGVFVSFEETELELAENTASLSPGRGLPSTCRRSHSTRTTSRGSSAGSLPAPSIPPGSRLS